MPFGFQLVWGICVVLSVTRLRDVLVICLGNAVIKRQGQSTRSLIVAFPRLSSFVCFLSFIEIMTGTTAKAQLVDLLLDPLRGCAGLYNYRQQLVRRVMKMLTLEVRDRLDYLRQINFPGASIQSFLRLLGPILWSR